MPSVLVTGANKGIGLAIVRGLVEKGYLTFLGSRDESRGIAAKESLGDAAKDLVQVVQLDVSDAASVSAAVSTVKGALAGKPLDGLINNAGGIAGGPGAMGYSSPEHFMGTMELNYLHSAVRVTEAFLPLLDTDSGKGRLVHVASGAAPSFVAKCSPEKIKALCHFDQTTMEGLQAIYDESVAIAKSSSDPEAVKAAFEAAGLADGAPYHLSKALMNGYTQVLCKKFPKLKVNSCSPGFIETDLTRPFAESAGKAPAEMGMLPVENGARCPLFLMTADFEGNGWYWGSDCQRSPMDKYRSPGDPPYTGGESQDSQKAFLSSD